MKLILDKMKNFYAYIIFLILLIVLCGIHSGSVYGQKNSTNNPLLPPVVMEPTSPEESDMSNDTRSINGQNISYLSYNDSDIGFKIDYPNDGVEVDIKLVPRTNSESLKSFGDAYFKNNENIKLTAYYRNASTTLVGLPAIKFIGTLIYSPNVYEQLKGEKSFTQKMSGMVTLLKEKRGFLEIIYYADKSNFSDHIRQVEHMIDSLQLVNKRPVIQED